MCTLICPISKKRLLVPARGNECKHLECFDLRAFMALNYKKKEWRCAICNEINPMENIHVDKFFLDILGKCTDDSIRFYDNNEWSGCNNDATVISIYDVESDNSVIEII